MVENGRDERGVGPSPHKTLLRSLEMDLGVGDLMHRRT